MLGIDIEMTPGWNMESLGEGLARARYEAREGAIDLGCYELLSGILLTDIDLACSTLPASMPFGPQLATINWCAGGRCEVDLGERGSIVVSQGELCLSSAHAQTFSYPTGAYRGFEVFVDFERLDADARAALAAFGLTEEALRATLCTAGLGSNLVPEGELASAVQAIEMELLREAPRSSWLLLHLCCLLMQLVAMDLDAAAHGGAYLQRSHRDMAQAVYQHIIATTSPSADLAPLAARFGVSEASLRAYFSRVYGQSPAAFARAHALAEAARLLRETDLPVADVSQACGYANPSKFSAAFHRAHGANPLEYRRRSRLG